MTKPDDLLVDVAATVESQRSNQMSLTVVVNGAVITGRLAPEAVWRERVAEVLRDSDRLGAFAGVFGDAGATRAEAEAETETEIETDGAGGSGGSRGSTPSHLHFHVARILQGTVGIPETGGMYRVAIEDVSAWTVGDFSYTDG
ncbi:hypothetical protein ACIRNI_05020 [Streptomyces sp. NPDC093546]|uniref:hypothetical protein n=1 Tax=Streptomyces sp. NPDC093546 TaxID=3366040 RepID=UPI003801AECF